MMAREGGAGTMAVAAVAVTIILALFGGVYSMAQSVSEVNAKLDRNCRILAALDQDIRIHSIEGLRRSTSPAFTQFPDVSC